MPFAEPIVFVLAILSALVFWELISRTSVVSERDLPAMSTSFDELWSMMQTSHFWLSFADTVHGWAIGLTLATLLAVPTGIALGSSDFLAAAFHIPIEFLRPIPAAALIPVLFLTLGPNLKSEIFLATFGAFRPLLIQTMYRVRDVDPVAIETARAFGLAPEPFVSQGLDLDGDRIVMAPGPVLGKYWPIGCYGALESWTSAHPDLAKSSSITHPGRKKTPKVT
jgi:ABC-type nitrate/sulfonate/bicarbonate transport system permease component